MARPPGSKNKVSTVNLSKPKNDEWDAVGVKAQRIIQWKEFSDGEGGDPRGAIVAAAIERIKEQLQELERIQVVAEIEPDAYSLRALKSLAEVRDAASRGIHVVADASFVTGTISDTQIALAAGISNTTVGKWRRNPVSFKLTE